MWPLVLLGIAGIASAGIPGTNGDIQQPALQKELMEEAKIYLFKFGYMIPEPHQGVKSVQEPTPQQIHDALVRFQSAFLYYSSGTVDVPTQAKMNEWRCANNDMDRGSPIAPASKKELWIKKSLTYKIVNTPRTLSEAQIRSAAHEAFEQWTRASGFKFVENNGQNPDITITFYDVPQSGLRIAGSASKPLNSHIILDKNQDWAYKAQAPMGISLYHTLLHEIGHVLGLPHTFYRGSIMHPIFKPVLLPFGTLDIVPNVDRLAIRKIYGPPGIEVEENKTDNNGVEENTSGTSDGGEGLSSVDHSVPSSDLAQSKCPKHIDSVVAINDQEWLLFRENKVYKLNNRKFVDKGRPIQQVFPRGPQFVNATVSSGPLTLLFVERTIYGYEYDGVQFTEAQNYPKELHDRVLFYPQGAFPLNNGSVILLSGNVFATYNVNQNAPSFLNDKNRYFPNLPDDVRSGIEKTQGFTDAYYMFDEATVSDYDMNSKQVLQLQNIPEFLKCT